MAATIDIRTTQNVTIEYELATLRDRALAYLIDFIIVVAFYFVFIMGIINLFSEALLGASMGLYILYGLFPLICFMGYHFLSEVLADGQSWGKKSIGIKVVRLDGKEPGLTDYLLRAVFHIIDSLFSMGIIGAMLISSSAKHQRLGDLTSNTTVIRVKHNQQFRLEDILSINSLENYEPQYPQVRQLSEQDMLLIKNVLGRFRQYRNLAHRNAVVELAERLADLLDIEEVPADPVPFLKTLIRDYIVLTR
jgi:uncharacterized RDD family membrane protein YckC